MTFLIILLGCLATFCANPIAGKSIIPPPPGNQCVSPNGKGLGSAIRELVDLIPGEDLLTIYLRAASEDKEVQDALEYLESDDFKKIIITMHNRPEFSEVMEYLCEDLHFDAYFYLNSLGALFNYPPMKRPKPQQSHTRNRRAVLRRNGFEGFLLDLKDALPMDKIRETYRRLYKEDEYLRLAMKKIGSDDFRKIGDAIEALPEYQHMLQRLREKGVHVDKILKALMDFFNWNPRSKPQLVLV